MIITRDQAIHSRDGYRYHRIVLSCRSYHQNDSMIAYMFIDIILILEIHLSLA